MQGPFIVLIKNARDMQEPFIEFIRNAWKIHGILIFLSEMHGKYMGRSFGEICNAFELQGLFVFISLEMYGKCVILTFIFIL